MNNNNKRTIIEYWLEKSRQDIGSAKDNLNNNRLQNAVRDLYYSFFHAFSALLFNEEKLFKKHTHVRAIFHRDYIKEGKIDLKWGKIYDWLFDNRQKADYRPLVEFDRNEITSLYENAQDFLTTISELIIINE